MTNSGSGPISQQQVHQWQSAFLQLNQNRLQIARSLMSPRQQIVLDVLPLMLHLNHPQLPGFINHNVPHGLPHFVASAQQLQSLQTIARGLQLPRGFSAQQIRGLYLMGSLGSLAQARSSDLDVWVCYDESLPADDIALLRNKCQLLERWAESLSVELHFFLMNLSDFRKGQSQEAEGEDCGSSQHVLLLDEFYRSSLWLGGCQPRWWLIPTTQERNADALWEQLLDQHRVHKDHWLDFGAIPTIPPAEFIGAGLWQLNKGLGDPYKSLLKLLLTRHYAGQYPNIRPLCWDLKDQVHKGLCDVESNDAYQLMLARLTRQLQDEGNRERVELARRAFYYKAKIPLSQLNPAQRNSWRAKAMLGLCHSWGWSEDTLKELDQRQEWAPMRVQKERNALISEMLGSYRFLAAFSQKYAPRVHISRQDMQTLGNRLYAAFDTRPGKIIDINPGISSSLGQEKLALNLKRGVWQLIPGIFYRSGDEQLEQQQVLKQSPSLVELLCFARYNGLLEGYTRIAIYPTHNPLSQYELNEISAIIRSLEPVKPNNAAFLRAPRPLQWHLLVNVGVDPQHELSRRGMQKISNRDDALGYSAARDNLVQTIDLVTINSWGEWLTERFTGDAAMLQCLQSVLAHLPQVREFGWPPATVHCHCASRASAIRIRVEQLLADVLAHFSEQPKAPYLIEASESWYLLENSRDGMQLRAADSPMKLLALLARPAKGFVGYTLDRAALLNSPLRVIFSEARSGVWQIWYWRHDGKVYFYFVDDKGALLHQQWPDQEGSSQYWLMPILRFLRQIDQRWQRQDGRLQPRKILITEMRRKAQSFEFELVRRRMPDLPQQSSSIDLRAVLDANKQPTLYCDGMEFSAWQFGNSLYQAVVKEVIARRGSRAQYPLFLGDLELPDSQNMIEHLQVKQRLETRLMHALQGHPEDSPPVPGVVSSGKDK
ncbi:class I adenylate cyclase [Thalassolituus sp. LLYu03]|uniref:class I adenylate cyclase n=1 Tax=Thalassolituus sp. LLYu03 TaxID=3421656 RepID=UPI003D29B82A